jgi:DNA polymerase type B, organellar and viral
MPATSKEALARKARAKEARRKLRRETDPAYAKLCREKTRLKSRARSKAKRDAKPFVGCDGEGIGRGRHHRYALLRIGTRELFADNRRLTTPECLSFILDAPADAILIGFAFEYDIANILRDVPAKRDPKAHERPSRLERILRIETERRDGKAEFQSPWVWLNFDGFPEFGVSYLPRHHLKVCLARRVGRGRRMKRRAAPGSIRTIHDAFGFFQKSFLGALQDWGVGREHWQAIADMKSARSAFERITREVRAYCELECELLAGLMTSLREACNLAGIEPRRWEGAGQLADAILRGADAIRRKDIEAKLPKTLLDMAHAGYYGGRFEVTRIGAVKGPIHERDINSAYPAAFQEAPCLRHGKWRKAAAADLQAKLKRSDALFVAPVQFVHPKDAFVCGLPFRTRQGALSWPREGRGVYWSPELRSALALGARIAVEGPGWLYERTCDCKPYGKLAALYEARKALEATGSKSKGIPLKLGINAVYGKRAQRIGGAPWGSPIEAGLVTAITRAKLNLAIASVADRRNVLMIATDAVYTIGEPPAVETGPGLGQWDPKTYPRMFVVKPGLYWPPKSSGAKLKLKSRGLSPKFFEPRIPAFRATWLAHVRDCRRYSIAIARPAPAVVVEVETFIGLRLAYRAGRLDELCRWKKLPMLISFDWRDKRGLATLDGLSFVLAAKPGDRRALSLAYERDPKPIEGAPDWREQEIQFEAMPEFVDLSIPWK